jgi:hypothetical protein
MHLSDFIKTIESGKITVSANDVEALEIKAASKKIDINATNKEFLKDTLSTIRRGNKTAGVREGVKGKVNGIKSVKSTFDMVKDVAEDLCKAGITVTLSYKGAVVVTIGSDANPKFSRLATKTKAIEINSPLKLIEIGI